MPFECQISMNRVATSGCVPVTAGSSGKFRDMFVHMAESERVLSQPNFDAAMDTKGLLALQAQVYRYAQSLDTATRVVDRTNQGIKQIMTGTQ